MKMYKCTDCNSEYEEKPDYCECGSNTFEEISSNDNYNADYDEQGNYAVQYQEDYPADNEVMTPEQMKELEAEKMEKTKSFIALGVILILCLLVFILPPHRKAKMPQAEEKTAEKTVQLPSAAAFWDDTLPSAYRKSDPLANLPLLNSRLGSISPVMREYLVNIGRNFDRNWNKSVIRGAGTCRVRLVIDKEGGLKAKNIISSSGNSSLDDSVSLLMTNTTGFNIPPDDYKGEKIYILFSVTDDGHSKISYPSK